MEPQTAASPEAAAAPAVPETGPAALETMLSGLEQRLDRLIEGRIEASEARRRETDRQVNLAVFAAAHPDFLERRADGSLAALRAANPLLDEVGAYFAHRLDTEQRDKAQAVEQARQDAEADLLARVKAKRLAATLGAAPAGPARGQGVDPELTAPEKFGGLTSVLAARLDARRKLAGN